MKIIYGLPNAQNNELTDSDYYKFIEKIRQIGQDYYAELLIKAFFGLLRENNFVFVSINPCFPNWIADENINCIYIRTSKGDKSFADFPFLIKKLRALGPGEAIIDTEFDQYEK